MTTPAKWERPRIDFIDPRKQPWADMKSRGELPHLYKECGSYFVTFRLWDAVVAKQESNRVEADAVRWSPREHAARLAAKTEPPLGLGSCVLGRPEAAAVVQDALVYGHGTQYLLAAWCVMPNHVHAAYTTLGDNTPASIHHAWKSCSSRQVNRLCQRTGALWERESFDHLIRSVEHYEGFIDYMERNPVVAGLCARPADWAFSSAHFA